MASILDNEEDIKRTTDLTLVWKTFEDVYDLYHSTDLQASIKLAGITHLLHEYKEDNDFPEVGDLPNTYVHLKQTKTRLEKNVEYLRAEKMSLQNEVGNLQGTVIELNGKIRALETLLGWFVHEHTKLDSNPDHAKGLDAVMAVHGIEDQSVEKIHDYAEQFKDL